MEYTGLVLLAALFFCCPGGSGPSDILQEHGSFILKTPTVNDSTYEGYNILDDYPANASSLYDVRIYNYSYAGEPCSVKIMAGWNNGGILPGTGNRAPDYPYPQIYNINFQVPIDYPLQFFLLCKDEHHYCKLLVDSMVFTRDYDINLADSVNVCNGCFSYTLNLEEYERDF